MPVQSALQIGMDGDTIVRMSTTQIIVLAKAVGLDATA
jgi:hypothetical protein